MSELRLISFQSSVARGDMALRLKDVMEEMKVVISSADSDREKFGRILHLAGEFLAAALAGEARNGQTAFLMVDRSLSHLAFVYPEHLARGNVLPIDNKSFAGQVVLTKAILLENSVPQEPHKDFFERIPGPAGPVRPIQKLIASPLADRDGSVIGVVEVSRAGNESAGPDANFTSRDSENLEKSCRVFAPFIASTWTRARGW